tara:strand:- start:1481 stop:2605 length:1125 start_codon:yes stop_codon:yes gene_type:complete
MTDRRLPAKITEKNKQNKFVLWVILIALVSTLIVFLLPSLKDNPKVIHPSVNADVLTEENGSAYGDDAIYDLENIDDLKEDVIAAQAFDDSELVQIFKQQETTSKSFVQVQQPKWLKNAVSWPYRLNKPMVAIVINDVNKAKQGEWQDLKNYDIPLTYTISTDDKNYQKLAKLANKNGREVVAHIPMEPLYPSKLPKVMKGKKWLKANDSEKAINDYVQNVLRKTPYVIGVSNQMGSAFTSNQESIKKLLAILKKKGYIFLDSMTTKDSKALDVARELKSPYLRRHLSFTFKDKKTDIKEVASRVLEKNKYLIVFVSPETKALKETLTWIKEKQTEGVEFVPLTAIMRRSIVQQKLPLNIDKKSKVFLRSPGLV